VAESMRLPSLVATASWGSGNEVGDDGAGPEAVPGDRRENRLPPISLKDIDPRTAESLVLPAGDR